jgi:hypothetical protein
MFVPKAMLWMTVAIAAMPCCVADETAKTPETEKEESPAQVAIRNLAKQCVFRPVAGDDGPGEPFVLHPEPLLKYGDPTRDIGSSALWVWMDGEVPAMFQKIEVNVHQGSNDKWTWCFANASSQKLECAWPEVRRGTITVNEVPTGKVPESPKVKEDAPASAWALTARQLSRKFTARDGDDELRLLPRPLLEFKAEKQNIPYGAVFGFATGTNPSIVVIIQAEKKNGEVVWTYRPLHMTSVTVELEYDGKKIWQEDGQPPNAVSTWGYYFSFREASIK